MAIGGGAVLATTRYRSGHSEVPAWFGDGKLRDVARDVVDDFGDRLLLYDDEGIKVVDAGTLKSQPERTGAAYSGPGHVHGARRASLLFCVWSRTWLAGSGALVVT